MTGLVCFGFLFIFQCEPQGGPTVVDSYAKQCRVYSISKNDTPQTQRNLLQNNERCTEAKAKKK